MHFVTYQQLYRDLVLWASGLGWRPDVVVGVPRSGMVPATMLALHWNTHLADPACLEAGRLQGGRRAHELSGPVTRVLVIDDAITTGQSLEQAMAPLKSIEDLELRTAAVYATRQGAKLVDHHVRLLPHPRIFAWNFIHHALLQQACVDIDGVLCQDPAPGGDDDGERYRDFLRHAPVHLHPSWPIHSLVTCRLERYRSETQRWLHRHQIRYRHLLMMPHRTRDERRAAGRHAEFKADHYVASRTQLFIESSAVQARRIARLSGKPVLCTEVMRLFEPGGPD